jgi:hypothetical protein
MKLLILKYIQNNMHLVFIPIILIIILLSLSIGNEKKCSKKESSIIISIIDEKPRISKVRLKNGKIITLSSLNNNLKIGKIVKYCK